MKTRNNRPGTRRGLALLIKHRQGAVESVTFTLNGIRRSIRNTEETLHSLQAYQASTGQIKGYSMAITSRELADHFVFGRRLQLTIDSLSSQLKALHISEREYAERVLDLHVELQRFKIAADRLP